MVSFFLGCKLCPFEPNLHLKDKKYLISLVKPKVFFVSEEAEASIEETIKTIGLNTIIVCFGKSLRNEELSNFLKDSKYDDYFVPIRKNDLRETALLMFSSGTTGNPKCVCLSDYSLMMQCEQFRRIYYGEERDITKFKCKEKFVDAVNVSRVFATLYWVVNVMFCIATVTGGYCRLLKKEFNGRLVWEDIEKYKVKLFWMYFIK